MDLYLPNKKNIPNELLGHCSPALAFLKGFFRRDDHFGLLLIQSLSTTNTPQQPRCSIWICSFWAPIRGVSQNLGSQKYPQNHLKNQVLDDLGSLTFRTLDASIRKNLALLAATGCTLWCYPLLQPRAAATVVELSFRLSLNPLTFQEKGSCRDSNWTASTVFWVMSHPTFLVMNHYSTISAAQKDPKKLLLSTKHPGRKVKLGGPRAGENHIESFRKVLGFARLNLFVHEFLRLVGSGTCSEFIEIPGQGAWVLWENYKEPSLCFIPNHGGVL